LFQAEGGIRCFHVTGVQTCALPIYVSHVSESHSRYARLSRAELAVLVPELLLIGQLIDRSGMAWCIQSFGRPEMLQIAIEEWARSEERRVGVEWSRRGRAAQCGVWG